MQVGILVALTLGLFIAASGHAGEPGRHAIADAHIHYVDFAQNTDGVEALIRSMDGAKVTDAVLWGLPVTKIWGPDDAKQPVHSLDAETRMYWDTKTDYIVAMAYTKATPEQQKRLHPFICGLNGNDRNSLDQVKRLIQAYPGVWQGIGELFAHHDYISYMVDGPTPRPDSPAYSAIYRFAGKYGMPVTIHTNITSGRNPGPIYLEQFLNAVKGNPETKFIWAHIGLSNDMRVPGLQKILAEQMEKHSNLYVDLSWLVFDAEIAPGGSLNREWLPVIENHPDRFMVGTDIVGRFLPVDKYKKEIGKYDVLLDALKPESARMVARENFLRLLPTGVVLRGEDRIQP